MLFPPPPNMARINMWNGWTLKYFFQYKITLRLLYRDTITATVEGTCLYWPIPPRWGSTAELHQNRTIQGWKRKETFAGNWFIPQLPTSQLANAAAGQVHSEFQGKFVLFGLFFIVLFYEQVKCHHNVCPLHVSQLWVTAKVLDLNLGCYVGKAG